MPVNPLPYRAYLFDLDGVLVDTRDWVREAYRHTAQRFSFDASDEALSRLYGQPLPTCYTALHEHGNLEELIECHREFQRSNMDLQRLFPGATETLNKLKQRGGTIALISSRSGPSLRITLDLYVLEPLLDAIIWPEDCVKHKPEPEPVHRALAALETAASDALVIGDTPNDILAGRAAGTDTAGATYGFIGDEVAHSNPTYLIHRITEVCDLVRPGSPPKYPFGAEGHGRMSHHRSPGE